MISFLILVDKYDKIGICPLFLNFLLFIDIFICDSYHSYLFRLESQENLDLFYDLKWFSLNLQTLN